MLHTAPSFSIFHSPDGLQEGEHDIHEELERDEDKKVREKMKHLGSGEFTFGKSISTTSMTLIEERDEGDEQVGVEPPSPPMYLATGLGCGGDFVPPSFDDVSDAGEFYKRMVDENPTNALFLVNYAKILESKGDLEGAEDYYFRASFIDPNDGEILMLYAKLVWQLHHDQDRAEDYFERAVQVSPQDRLPFAVLSAYARFLWEIEDGKEEDFPQNDQNKINEDKTHDSNARIDDGISGGNTTEDADTEEYYKRMADENPHSSIVLRTYAQFLYKTKGDVLAAEDNYTRAILADPMDGETKSEYAKLIWYVHHDRHKAVCYFEQAVLASPEDSNVLAAYAQFLWEAGEDEEEDDTEMLNA